MRLSRGSGRIEGIWGHKNLVPVTKKRLSGDEEHRQEIGRDFLQGSLARKFNGFRG